MIRIFQAYTIGLVVFILITIGIAIQLPAFFLYYVLVLLLLAFGFYLWDVVFSVYRDIKKEELEENNQIPMTYSNKV